jgi:hypothetical protein
MGLDRTRPRTRALASALLAALLGTACTLAPRDPSFDGWLVGDPDRDYDDHGLEYVPAARLLYGAFLTAPYAARDVIRIAISPLVFAYCAGAPGKDVPELALLGPDRPEPPRAYPD